MRFPLSIKKGGKYVTTEQGFDPQDSIGTRMGNVITLMTNVMVQDCIGTLNVFAPL